MVVTTPLRTMEIIRQIKKKVRDVKFRLFGNEAALREIFDMALPNPSQLDFSEKKFKALLKACDIDLTPRGAGNGWDLSFKGKTKHINGPLGNNINITTIREVRDFLVCSGVENPSMIYKFLPGT